jgi:hypothetical protein
VARLPGGGSPGTSTILDSGFVGRWRRPLISLVDTGSQGRDILVHRRSGERSGEEGGRRRRWRTEHDALNYRGWRARDAGTRCVCINDEAEA